MENGQWPPVMHTGSS